MQSRFDLHFAETAETFLMCRAVPMDVRPQTAKEQLADWSGELGYPKGIFSQNEPMFRSDELDAWYEENKI